MKVPNKHETEKENTKENYIRKFFTIFPYINIISSNLCNCKLR